MSATVVITGSTRGIGRGLAREFLARGCNVVVSGRNAEAVELAVKELGADADPARVTGLAGDVRDDDHLQALWDHAAATFGSVDHWINNAGVSNPRRPLWDVPADKVQLVVDTNLVATINATRVALVGMREQGRGAIWNMEGFGSGNQKADGMSIYGAAKRGLRYFSQAVNKDLGKGSPVAVGTLSPGIVLTDMLFGDYDGQPEKLEKAKKIFNILGDTVETVTPHLADAVLKAKPGAHIEWLTRSKAFGRFATAGFRKRNLVEQAGGQG